MKRKIVDLVDKIFAESLYSKETVKAKRHIADAFEKKFEQLCKHNNEIEARIFK